MKKTIIMTIMAVFLIVSVFNPYGFASEKQKANIQPQMVSIPAGEFMMGVKVTPPKKGEKKKYICTSLHKVFVDAFYLDKYEVTNHQYFKFCKATDRKLPVYWGKKGFHCGPDYSNHPVVGVSNYDAKAYAKWRGVRLPTEAEWEYAARGGLVGKKYPNQDKIKKENINYGQNQPGTTVVGSYPPNGFGLYDMAGNVREWVADYFHKDYYLNSPSKNPKGPEIGKFHVIRGGSWFSGPGCVTVHRRNALSTGWVDFAVGFRCAKDAKK